MNPLFSLKITFMRGKYSFIFAMMVLFSACIDNEKNAGSLTVEAQKVMEDTTNFTTIQWIDSVKDLGKIQEGPLLDVSFRFKNTGTKPLVIADVSASCGCTVVEKPAQPVMPGAEGTIKGTFDSQGRVGSNTKSIVVKANTKPTQNFQLQFSIQVEKKH